jgi:hypothetical protein
MQQKARSKKQEVGGTTAAFLIRSAARRNSVVLSGLKPNC